MPGPYTNMLGSMRRFQKHSGVETLEEAARILDAVYLANKEADEIGNVAAPPAAAPMTPAKGTH